jgi:hypothetical protein
MNTPMIDAEVRYRMNEIRRQAARSRGPRRDRSDEAAARPHLEYLPSSQDTGLRGRIGLALVETGLHLLASGAQGRA